MLSLTYLAALHKIEKKDEELQRKFEEVSQKIEKKINDQKLWFLLRKALQKIQKSFGIKIINRNEPIIAPLIVLHPFLRNEKNELY